MYIDRQDFTLKNEKTYTRILLRESYRKDGKVKKRTIANISKLPPLVVDAIGIALKKGQNISKEVSTSKVKTILGPSIGAVITLNKICAELKITKMLGKSRLAKLTVWMIIARLIKPTSKLATVRLANQHAACDILGMESFTEEDLYRSLDWLAKNQDKFEKKLFKARYGKNIPTLYLYDVTSSYLEGTKNEFADFGYPRDKKKGKMQIVIGLMTDGEGGPVSISVFNGNTNDTKTFNDQIRKLSDDFNVTNVVMVGDKGMIKSQQIKDLKDDFYYITSITKSQIKTLMGKDVIQLGLFDNDLFEVTDDGVRYILRKNPGRKNEIRENRESKISKIGHEIKARNDYLEMHPRAWVTTAIKKVETLAEKLKVSNFITVTSDTRVLSLVIDGIKLKEISKLDGCYIIKTNVPKKVADKKIIHDRYKDLKYVENAFRTMKTMLLEIRPLYLRDGNRTRGHVFMVMLAYMVAKHLRDKWDNIGVTVDEGIDELASICAVKVDIAGVEIDTVPEPRKLGKKLLERLDVTLPKSFHSKGINVATRKQL